MATIKIIDIKTIVDYIFIKLFCQDYCNLSNKLWQQ